jgi:hypothetical protein
VVVASVLAAGAPPAEAASYTTGGYQVAMQANTGHLFAYDPQDNAHKDANLGMAAGSSPSVAPGPEMAFQASTGHLYLYHPADNVSRDVGLGMAAGTSPAIDGQPGDRYEVAFQANTGHLFVYDTSANKATDSGLGMAAGTSPSIVRLPGGGYQVAFQASTGHLFTYNPQNNTHTDTALGMASKTSPATTAPLPAAGNSAVVTAAESQVGYQDNPSGGFCNKFSAYWGAGSSCGNGNYSEEWCADFAAWAWRQGGVSFTYGFSSGDINAAAASFYQWGVAQGTWHSAGSGYTPQPGDAVVYGLNSAGTSADHVAIVTSYTSGAAGPNVVNGDWWSSGNGGVVAASDQTTATGSDGISGYASP